MTVEELQAATSQAIEALETEAAAEARRLLDGPDLGNAARAGRSRMIVSHDDKRVRRAIILECRRRGFGVERDKDDRCLWITWEERE